MIPAPAQPNPDVQPPAIADLLPHAPPMVLLDEVVECGGEHLIASVRIRPDSEFCVNGEVGIWVAIEYMAQAVAAWSGWQARLRGEPIKIGYLLGTRRFDCEIAGFAVGDQLQIAIEREFQADNGLARFHAQVRRDGLLCASAGISVFGPPDA